MKVCDVEDSGVVLPMGIRRTVSVFFVIEACHPVMAKVSVISKIASSYIVHPLIWDVHNKSSMSSESLLKLLKYNMRFADLGMVEDLFYVCKMYVSICLKLPQ